MARRAERQPQPAAKRHLPVWLWVVIGVAVAVGLAARFWSMASNFRGMVSERRRSNQSAVFDHTADLEAALNEYAARHKLIYPATLEQLCTPDADGRVYWDSIDALRDPWGHSYLYLSPPDDNAVPIVYSAGPDGIAETEDDVYSGSAERQQASDRRAKAR